MSLGKGKAAIVPYGKGKATAVQPVTMTPGNSKTATALPVTTTPSKGKAAAAPDKAAVAPPPPVATEISTETMVWSASVSVRVMAVSDCQSPKNDDVGVLEIRFIVFRHSDASLDFVCGLLCFVHVFSVQYSFDMIGMRN
jgi:hypothetical protein